MIEWLSNPQNAGAISVIFAGLTAIATLAAAVTAVLGPYISASLQRKHTKDMVERDTKLRIFGILMGYRQRWGERESVQALNLIDIVWINNSQVRKAWHEFFRTTEAKSDYSPSQQRDAYQRMLERMAEDLGFAGEFRDDDYARVFYSNAVHWEDQARMKQNLQMAYPNEAPGPSLAALYAETPAITKSGEGKTAGDGG